MFTILLSIVFTTCILAAPIPLDQSSLWNKLKEDKSLERFQSTLLNETMLPFLNECYINQLGQTNRESKTQESICSRYFDAIVQLSNSDYVVNAPKVLALRDQVKSVTFCEEKHTFPVIKYFPKAPPRDFNNTAVCGQSCLEDDLKAKDICTFLAWMGEEIMKNSASNKKSVALTVVPPVAVASVAVTPAAAAAPAPAAPTKASQITDIQVQSNQTAVAVNEKEKNPVSIKADATPAEKPTPNSSITHLKPFVQPNIAAEIPIANDAEGKNSPIELPKPTTGAAIVSKVPKEENSQKNPQDEGGKDDIAPAPLNTSAQNPDSDEEENHSENDTDPENEDFEMKDNFGKPNTNNIDIANPDENEHNQSSSPEIVGNDIVNNKPVVDPFLEESGSNFFSYFLVVMFLCIAMYVLYHNKSKVLALLLEGRRGDKGRSGRRKHTAAYRKLDSNLEEAITSSASGRTTQIIY